MPLVPAVLPSRSLRQRIQSKYTRHIFALGAAAMLLPAAVQGQTAVGSSSATQTATVTITTAATLSSIHVLTQGAENKDFQYASGGTCAAGTAYAANTTCTVNYTFAPTRPGQRLGGIVLMDTSGPIGQALVAGTGTGPLVEFPGSTALSTVGSGFSSPTGVAVDGSGNVFIADYGHDVVKEIVAGTGGNPAGVVSSSSTVMTVGSGFSGPAGVAVDGSGNVFVGDRGHNVVKEIVAGTGGNAAGVVSSSSTVVTVGVSFASPTGLAVDGSGNVFVADWGHHAVKEIVAGTGGNTAGVVSLSSMVVTVSGGFTNPSGVSVDGSGNVFVADTNNSAVKEIVAGTGGDPAGVVSSASTVVTVGSGFSVPAGVAVDGSGNVFVADTGHNAVKEIVAGTGGNAVGVVSSSSTVMTVGSGFSAPYGVSLDLNGLVFVAGFGNSTMKEIDLTSPPALSFVSTAVNNTSSDSPKSVTLQNAGNASLTFAVPGTGNNPSISADFLFGGSSTCPLLTTSSSAATLAAGTSCIASISFKPLSPGSINGSLVFTDDALNASPSTTQTIALSGTATTPLTSFTITGLNAATAGTPQTITVTAKASGGVTYTGYNGTVHFTSSDAQAVLPANYTFTASDNGVHTFPVTLKTAGSQSVTVTDVVSTTATGTASATITAGAAASYFLDAPGTAPFYTAFSFNAYAQDAYGNTATSYNGTAIMSSSDTGFSNLGPFTFSNGATTVSAAFKTAGNNTLTLTDAITSSITGSATIYMAPGPVRGLTVSAPAATTAGQAISVTVRARDLFDNTVTGYTGTVSFSSTDTRAILPSSYTFTGADSGSHTFSATLKTPGDQTITATDTGNSVAGTSDTIAVTSPLLVVTVNTDAAANAANCTLQAASGSGTDSSCRLRDALAKAAALGSGTITFDSAAFATAKTINLTSGALAIPAYTSIQGAASGSGSSQVNLVTVRASSSEIFTVASSVTNSLISNLITSGGVGSFQAGCLVNHGSFSMSVSTLTGCSGVDGGAIFNDGTLTLDRDTISSNSASLRGAGISNTGTLTLARSTVGGNIADAVITSGGGGLYNSGTVTMIGDTVSNNAVLSVSPAVPPVAGGIYNSGTLGLANSVVAGNYLIGAGGIAADIFGGGIADNGGNKAGSSSLPVSLIDIKLASLANYGGPVATMVPLPGSPAICAGAIANIPGSTTFDQRGYPRTTNYGGTPCVDSGATQSSFSLTFVQQPSDVVQNVAMTPAPKVALAENGNAFTPAVTIPLTLQGTGTLTGGSAGTSSGTATYSALKVDTAGTGKKLQAALTLNSITSTAISATSNAFNVLSGVSQLLFGTSPASPIALGGNAGTAISVKEAASDSSTITTATDTITLTVTGPSSYSQTYTAAAVNGVATFNLSSVALNHAGSYTYTASLGSLQAIATQTVDKGTAIVTLGGLSATYDGSAHAATATTSPTGLTVNFTYNGSSTAPTAAGSYAVVGTVSDADYQGTAAGTLAIDKATAAVALGSLSATYDGSPHAATATTTPAGLTVNVTYNGSATAPTAAGSYAVVATISDANYQGTASGTLAVGKAAAPVTLGSLSATYDGSPHAATATTTPAGLTVNFTYNGSATVPTTAGSYAVVATISDANYQGTAGGTLTIGKASATVTLGNLTASYDGSAHAATATTTPSGLTVTLTYNGSSSAPTAAGSYAVVATVNDSNYQGAATETLTIGKVTPTITWAAPAAIIYGTPLSAIQLNATAGTTGTFAYTPTAGTILAAGANQQLTVAFTPNDTANYQDTSASTAITVNKQGSATALTATAASLSPLQTVTFTATVTPATTGAPSGTVTFLDGSTALQTVTLTGATASYSTTLASGTHTITASYSGNGNYLASTSTSGVTITVAPLDFAISSTGPSSKTVIPGGAVNFTYALTPSFAAYPGPVTFSVSGLPNGASYTLSPGTIAANAGPQQVTLTIQTPMSTAGMVMQHRGWAFSVLLLPFAGMRRLRDGSKKLARTLYILLAFCSGIGMTGCGSGNGFLIQGVRDYAVTVTASSGTVSHTSTVNLNVQ